jgi:hypothetical protein
VLKQALDYVRTGQLHLAQPLVVEYLKQDSKSAEAWYLLSFCVGEQRQQIDCLQRALRIDPSFREAQSRLIDVMTAVPQAPAEPAPEPVEPAEETPALLPETVQSPEPPPEPPAALRELPTEPEMAELREQLASPEKGRRRSSKGCVLVLVALLLIAIIAAVVVFVFIKPGQPPASQAVPTSAATPTVATATPTNLPTPTSIPTETPTLFPPTWTPTPMPTARPANTSTPFPPPDATIDTAMRLIERQVSATRGLQIGAATGRFFIQSTDVELALRGFANSQGLLTNLNDHTYALSVLGLIKPAYNLVEYTLNSLADNYGGFYVPSTKEAYVVGRRFGSIERYVYARQFARALIDMHFLLENTNAYPCALDAQQCEAIHAVVEGDTALIADQWLRQNGSDQDRQAVSAFRPPNLLLPDEFAPLSIQRDLAFVRDDGAAFVQYLYQRGGWNAINKVYSNLPLSTEQILHPEKYVANDKPIDVSLLPLSSTFSAPWRMVEDGVLGEWTTSLVLSAGADEQTRLKDDVAANAARGWGGDRYQVFFNDASGDAALVAQWRWDTANDAQEFKQAMMAYLDLRFDRSKLDRSDGDCWAANHQATCLFTIDQSTLWVLVPDAAMIDTIRAAFH